MYVRSLGIILIPKAIFVPNFISFAASIAELARGEKSRTLSLTQSHSLFDARELKLLLRNNYKSNNPGPGGITELVLHYTVHQKSFHL